MRENGGVTAPETPDATPESAPEQAAASQAASAAEPVVAREEATLRRAPRVGVFLVIGVIFGVLLTLVLTSLFEPDPNVGFAASFGYFLIYGVPFGVLVFGLIALALDRRSKRRARTVSVEHERVD